MNEELKPCPFCGSNGIKYSLKMAGRYDRQYHASMYCDNCHCYGKRTLTKKVSKDDYKGRRFIENDESIKTDAIIAWNTRI